MDDRFKTVAAAYVRDFERLYFVPLARHKLHLHLALGADEKYLAIGHKLTEAARDRKRGIYMSGGTAAGEDEFHKTISFRAVSDQ